MSDNITLPREVVEQLLKMLEMVEPYADQFTDYSSTAAEWPLNLLPEKVGIAITALRTAFAAEPVKPEPVAVFDEQMGHPVLLLGSPMLKDKQPLYTAPPALAAEQPKPVTLSRVALAWSNRKGTKFVGNGEKWKHEDCVVPLYVAEPVKPEPVKPEPVAWQCREHGDDEWFDCSKEAYGINPSRYVYRRLYTAPPDVEALRREET